MGYSLLKYVNNIIWIALAMLNVFYLQAANSQSPHPTDCSLNRVVALKKKHNTLSVKLGVAWPVQFNSKPAWITPHHVISEATKIVIVDCHEKLHPVKIQRSDLERDITLLMATDSLSRGINENIILVNTQVANARVEINWKLNNTFHFPYSGSSWTSSPINPDSLHHTKASQELGKAFNEKLLVYDSMASFPTASGSLIYSSGNKLGMLLRSEFFASRSLFLPFEEIASFLLEEETKTTFSFISEDSILLSENKQVQTILSDPCLSSSHVSQWIDTGGGTWGNGGGGTWGNGGGGTWGNGGGGTWGNGGGYLSRSMQNATEQELFGLNKSKSPNNALKSYLDFIVKGFTQHAYLSTPSSGIYLSLPTCKERALIWQKWDKRNAKYLASRKLPFIQVRDKTMPLTFDKLTDQDLKALALSDPSKASSPILLSHNKSIPIFNSTRDSNEFLLNAFCPSTKQKYFSNTQTSYIPVSSLPYIMGLDLLNTLAYEFYLFNESNQNESDAFIECQDHSFEASISLNDTMSLYLKASTDSTGVLKIIDESSPLSAEFTIQPLSSWAQSESNLSSNTSSRPATTSIYYELALSRDSNCSSSYFELYLNNLKLGNEHAKPIKIILK